MKWIAAAMILFGTLGMAAMHALCVKQDLAFLTELRDALELMEGEIRYGKRSLPECFYVAGKGRNTKLGQAFLEIGKRTGSSEREQLGVVMEEVLAPVFEGHLSGEEALWFYEFAPSGGYLEEEMQRRSLERIRLRMEEILRKRKEESRGKCRVAWSLGLSGGLFLILFLW